MTRRAPATGTRVPLDWAATQNNLGNALLTLGVRESGTERLEDAIAALRDALEERTRTRVPLDWAVTRLGLGNALAALAERSHDKAGMREAIACAREAERVYRDAGGSHWPPIAAQRISEMEEALAKMGP